MPSVTSSATAPEVSRRLPTAAALIQAQARSCGIRREQSSTGAGFHQELRVPQPLLTPAAPHSSSSGTGTVGQIVADVRSGPSLAQPQ
jgi:hypothetical protein